MKINDFSLNIRFLRLQGFRGNAQKGSLAIRDIDRISSLPSPPSPGPPGLEVQKCPGRPLPPRKGESLAGDSRDRAIGIYHALYDFFCVNLEPSKRNKPPFDAGTESWRTFWLVDSGN